MTLRTSLPSRRGPPRCARSLDSQVSPAVDVLQHLDRSDRHVRRSRLRLRDERQKTQVEFALSEALRSVSLPGEAQGWVYYFRSVCLTDMPADGDRVVWLEKMQQALTERVGSVVHGGDQRAAYADVVFFRSHEEGFELLLRRVMRREASAEWFWPLVTGVEPGAPRSELVAVIVERLRELPGAWSRVAQALFSQTGDHEALEVAAVLPVASVARWVRELDANGPPRAASSTLPLSEDVANSLARAAQKFGREDPRTIWLASLAALFISPISLATGSVVALGRAALRRIDAPQTLSDRIETRPPPNKRHASSIAFDGDADVSKIEPPAAFPTNSLQQAESFERPSTQSEDRDVKGRSIEAAERFDAPEMHQAAVKPETSQHSEPVPAAESYALAFNSEYLGIPTKAAGLLFLLNSLQYVGIAKVIAANPQLAELRIPARILLRLAEHAGVVAPDPILTWLHVEIVASEDAFASLQLPATSWPAQFGRCPRPDVEAALLVRGWSLAVRRWCWRIGRLTVRDVVTRHARFIASRTDLDVSLPLDDADIRIRRIGLDIDPGWLPWFGRVVRFHYVRQEPSSQAC
jgi:hypothetical protein